MATNDGYLGSPRLKRAGEQHDWTQDQVLEYAKCAQDPVYFIKNYVKIVNVDEGLVPFKMWPFQEEMVHTFHQNRFSISKMPRQVGKTTTTAGYMLWSVLFNEDYTVGILANKHALAKDILGRIQKSYEYLPKWLQQGIVSWNKSSIELENGSKIYAYATSAAGVRGGTYNLIFLDEFAFVPHGMAVEFFTSTYPVISSGRSTKVIIVSTPNGMNMFYKMWMDSIEGRSLYKPIEVHWSSVPGRDEKWKEETIRNTSEEQFRQEFETEFIGSSHTLISGTKLRQMGHMNAIQSMDGFDVFVQPIEGHVYSLTVDTSRGTGNDYSAFSVIDVTQVPYIQVAKYRDNKIDSMLFPSVIYSAAKKYNEGFVLVETNDIGQQVVDILHHDLEYENIFKLESHSIKGQSLAAGFKKSVSFGLRTTTAVKKIGCANLKTLVENDKLIIHDFDTISELTTFVQVKNSFEAEEGYNDDLAMTLVLFSWMVAQNLFKETTNTDIRQRLVEQIKDQNSMIDEDIAPVGFMDNGKEPDSYDDGEDLWNVVRDRGYISSSF